MRRSQELVRIEELRVGDVVRGRQQGFHRYLPVLSIETHFTARSQEVFVISFREVDRQFAVPQDHWVWVATP